MSDEKAMHITNIFYDCVPNNQKLNFAEQIKKADDAVYDRMVAIPVRNPSTVTLLSVFLGVFGVDRFYIGDILLGFIKLLVTLVFPIGYVMWISALISGSAELTDEMSIIALPYLWAAVMNIWWLVDILVCRSRTKKKTYRKLIEAMQ